jgi:hypothetical protein
MEKEIKKAAAKQAIILPQPFFN